MSVQVIKQVINKQSDFSQSEESPSAGHYKYCKFKGILHSHSDNEVYFFDAAHF